LLSEAGKDATDAFEDVGHSDDARSLLPKMLVGAMEGAVSALGFRIALVLLTSECLPTIRCLWLTLTQVASTKKAAPSVNQAAQQSGK
jgi:cytochrome b involved in lipid metabolism